MCTSGSVSAHTTEVSYDVGGHDIVRVRGGDFQTWGQQTQRGHVEKKSMKTNTVRSKKKKKKNRWMTLLEALGPNIRASVAGVVLCLLDFLDIEKTS